MQEPKQTFAELITAAEAEMQGYQIGYNSRTKDIWHQLERYAAEKGIRYFSTQLAEAFLREKHNYPIPHDGDASKRKIGLIKQRAFQKLEWVQEFGYIVQRISNRRRPLKPEYACVLDEFALYCRVKDYSAVTERTYTGRIWKFTQFLITQGENSYSAIKQSHISDYVSTFAGYAQSTIRAEMDVLVLFLKFLYIHGFSTQDLSVTVPRPRYVYTAQNSRIWSSEEIEQILAAVDRGNPRGKRDYAILLLAARLGMRDSDIRKLALDNICWEESAITYTQSKTGVLNSLPISEEIGSAIIDYLRYGRPKTDSDKVFVSLTPPYVEMRTAGKYINQYTRLAGIPIYREKHAGLHSLRHTLATRLITANVSVDYIIPILGHADDKSIHRYMQMDIESLRKCALTFEGGPTCEL